MRPLIYIALGWLLLAAVGGLGHTLGLTVMLPATSAALVAHIVDARLLALPAAEYESVSLGNHENIHQGTPAGLLALPAAVFVAVSLGYLEDIHQGTPAGLLSLAHGVTCLALVWSSRRLAVESAISRAVAAGVAAALVDVLTFALLLAARRRLDIDAAALVAGLALARWHALATVLAAPAVFFLAERASAGWDRLRGHRTPTSRRPRARAAEDNLSL